MVIRKTFKSECAHIVRGAYTHLCKCNFHGHSYVYELFLKSDTLDNAGMVTDFTFVKKYFKSLFDSFDHASVLLTSEKPEILNCFKNNFERVIISKWNSTAELQSMFFTYIGCKIIDYLTENRLWENGETGVTIDSVIVHETQSGYAKTTMHDITMVSLEKRKIFNDIEFSNGIQKEWTPEFKKFWEWLKENN